MGMAKIGREAIARGDADPGIVGFRHRDYAGSRVGLLDAPWAKKAQNRRLAKLQLKRAEQARRFQLANAAARRKRPSEIRKACTTVAGGPAGATRLARKLARQMIRIAGGVVGS